jgi:TetR/AcrR family transcriptional regulator
MLPQPASPLPTAPATSEDAAVDAAAGSGRKRPRPGERRIQILQTLASMLEQPDADRITTAALAARLEVSEAALYRHFASKAQMFEGLIEFIESSLFTLFNQITQGAGDGRDHARNIVLVLLQFAERNPGMTRVMVGDALILEHERLSARMVQLFDRFESQLKQCLREAGDAAGSATATVDAQVRAAALTALALGRLQRFARSGFKRSPTEHAEATLALMTA